jgi:hypothetical protein
MDTLGEVLKGIRATSENTNKRDACDHLKVHCPYLRVECHNCMLFRGVSFDKQITILDKLEK